jgi:hypothetical protein
VTRPLALPVLAAVLLASAGCGGGSSGGDALQETADRLGEIRSGELTVRLLVQPVGHGEDVGFELQGPFALPTENSPASARLRYTQIRGANRGGVTVVLASGQGYIQSNGTFYELPPDVTRTLQRSAGSGADPLDGLDLERWLVDPKVERAGSVEHVTGRVDSVAALNDLLELARDLGRTDLHPLQGKDVERFRQAVRSASLELETGADDRLLRRLSLALDLGLDVPRELRRALGASVGAEVRFELAVARPNTPVRIAAPASARPYEELVPAS